MKTLNIQATQVFEQNWTAFQTDRRFIVNMGSTRSSKTISICQCIILYALSNHNKSISIVRKTFPALRATVMIDFIRMLKELNIYDETAHNKTEHTYTFRQTNSVVSFFPTSDEQRLRGRSHDLIWCNEGNELYLDDFTQLNLRCREKIIIDFNPSDVISWVYDLPEENKVLIHSTYKQNPFLEDAIVKEIEQLKYTDETLWTIFGLGQRSMSKKNVYTHWQWVNERPDRFKDDKFIYGLDFGFNHPTALVKIYWHEKELYIENILYESYLTTSDLIQRFKQLNIEREVEIMADYSRPEIIYELREAGYNVMNADKRVSQGINTVKSYQVFVNEDKDLRKEYENYRWKVVGETITDEPIKMWDHANDAIRYGTVRIKQAYGSDDSLLKMFK